MTRAARPADVAGPITQASGRTAILTGPAGSAAGDGTRSGPSCAYPVSAVLPGLGAWFWAAKSMASPMKPATNSDVGCSYSALGAPLWAMAPRSITTIWSLTASASDWSWVT